MKKKLLGAILTVSFVFALAFSLTACGGNEVLVDLRGKVYTFSAEETWSAFHLDSNGVETPIDNPEQWLTDNWSLLRDENDKIDFETGRKKTPAQLIAYYKGILFNGNSGFLKGASITISEPTKTDGAKFYCAATVVVDGQTIAEEEVFGTYDEYFKGYFGVFNEDNGNNDTIGFQVMDYDAKTGRITDVSVVVSKPLGNGGFFAYHSKLATSINLTTSGEFFCIRCEYKLVDVNNLT